MALSTLLVANRGEIARRVISAARDLGISTVAVYADADRSAPHVAEADVAVFLVAPPGVEPYLSVEALVEAARRSGADALHPGYGFLSESPALARACKEAGIVFVGPPAEVIETMGDKLAARAVAEAAGVPVAPAVSASDSGELARLVLDELGLPALVKPSAGGGGKGMHVVRRREELRPALRSAAREAEAAFGDATLFVERFYEDARHIEVQIAADVYGEVLHLFERDCSVQRRHQKVIEEAPAPRLDPALRSGLLDAAVGLARKVGYVGLGTVEFLVADGEAHFLEMNTRLQVEHRVTEAITGLDLVELQLGLAAGEHLEPIGRQLAPQGHSIEVRLYAEDPDEGFSPQAGTPSFVRLSPRVLIDSALLAGQQVEGTYDPMLAKLVSVGPTREAARRTLLAALDECAVFGMPTNLALLRQLVASPAFTEASIDTGWLDRGEAARLARPDPELALVATAWLEAERVSGSQRRRPFAADGFRLSGPPAPFRVELILEGSAASALVRADAGGVEVGGHHHVVRPGERGGEVALLEVDGEPRRFVYDLGRGQLDVAFEGATFCFGRPSSGASRLGASDPDGAVVSPMPGSVVSVDVEVGRLVEAGELLGVVESMKTELPLRAPLAGVVAEVRAVPGAHVERHDRLFVVEKRAGP